MAENVNFIYSHLDRIYTDYLKSELIIPKVLPKVNWPCKGQFLHVGFTVCKKHSFNDFSTQLDWTKIYWTLAAQICARCCQRDKGEQNKKAAGKMHTHIIISYYCSAHSVWETLHIGGKKGEWLLQVLVIQRKNRYQSLPLWSLLFCSRNRSRQVIRQIFNHTCYEQYKGETQCQESMKQKT